MRPATRARLNAAMALLLLSLGAGAVQAQGAPPISGTPLPLGDPESGAPSASVRLDGRVLFRVTTMGQYRADVRAKHIAERVAVAASDRAADPDSIRGEDFELGTQLFLGGHRLVIVSDADAAIAGTSRAQYAGYVRLVLRQAIQSYRSERGTQALLWATARSLIATVIALALWLVIRWVRRRTRTWFEREITGRVRDIRIQAAQLIRREYVVNALTASVGIVYVAALTTVAFLYLEYLFGQYPWTRAVGTDLLGLVLDPIRALWSGFLSDLPGLLFIVVLAVLTRVALSLLKLVAAALENGSIELSGFDAEWSWPTYRIARVLIFALAIVVAYPYIPGSDSSAFKGVSLLLGVLVSLGSSSVVGNVIAGYTMIYRRAFRVGDRIRVDDVVGEVTAIRVLVTHLRTPKNEEVILPNSLILGATVTNYSSLARKKGLILHTSVGIGYEVPWRQVEAMLLLAAKRTAGLMKEPEPFVLQRALADFAVTYELNVYTDSPNAMLAQYSELHRNVLDVFNEYGVQIMTPAYEGDPETPKVVPRDQWLAAPASAAEGPPRTPAGN